MSEQIAENAAPAIERVDRYSLTIDGYRVTANPAQETALRSMDAAAVRRFLTAMGRPIPSAKTEGDR